MRTLRVFGVVAAHAALLMQEERSDMRGGKVTARDGMILLVPHRRRALHCASDLERCRCRGGDPSAGNPPADGRVEVGMHFALRKAWTGALAAGDARYLRSAVEQMLSVIVLIEAGPGTRDPPPTAPIVGSNSRAALAKLPAGHP